MIQLQGQQASDYKAYLDSYRLSTGKEPSYKERTEAFFCAISKDAWKQPNWMRT